MATYHKPSSGSEKKVALLKILSLAIAGLIFIYEVTMDKIYECANNFNKLIGTKYLFAISSKRQVKTIVLDFTIEDFRHATGLRYIDDISIEKNPSKLINSILNGNLTDTVLEKSAKYKATHPEGGSVEERVSEFRYLEEYLDKSDIVRIFKVQDFGSRIEAEYFIEATSYSRHSTVYIFIRQRIENENYVVVSFFKKHNTYSGDKAYWMLKEKITDNECIVLYKHSRYNNKDKKCN